MQCPPVSQKSRLRALFRISAILVLSLPFAALAQRSSLPLADSWNFLRQDAAADAPTDKWESVSVPHTWNAFDGQDGKKAQPQFEFGYYRGPAWYARKLDVPADWKGRRIFLKFDAASLVADVYLNGTHLGQHRGGFSAFVYEVTGIARPGGENELRVKVDNTRFEDVIPLSGDFTIYGGLYRPVQMFATDQTCITPLDHGSSGVLITQKRVSEAESKIAVQANISNALSETAPVAVIAEVVDAAGKIVRSETARADIASGATAAVTIPLTITQPHLWNGRPDPYLYQVRVRLLRGGRDVDEVTQPLGLRTVQITEDQGFLLNGKPYPIYGVNRHQEQKNKGWALSPTDDELDFKIIADMGATAVRLGHYPQNDGVLAICDRLGLLVWEEIPIVEQIRPTREFAENARQQMKEMILQGYNHPSIAMWGIYNELNATWVKIEHADPRPVLTSLRDLAHEMDPSRPVVGATWTPDKPLPSHSVPDWQCLNTYPGWYWGTAGDLDSALDQAVANYGKKRTALSEYGCGANTTQHMEGAPSKDKLGKGWNPEKSQYHPEDYQTYSHITQWAQIKDNPKLWGSFIWVMFDFASEKREEGDQPGINDKGMVTRDRQLKKDAYFFYKANWNPQPMVFIANRRHTPRKEATTDIQVFANTGEVELKLNGKSLGPKKPDRVAIATWEGVTLVPGKNHLEAVSTADGKTLSDACEWVVSE